MKRRNDVRCCKALFEKKFLKQYFRKQLQSVNWLFVLITGFNLLGGKMNVFHLKRQDV